MTSGPASDQRCIAEVDSIRPVVSICSDRQEKVDRGDLALATERPFAVSVGAATLARLTVREREVLRNMARGESNRVLARRLGIAERTVRAHITSIVRKLGVVSRFEAGLVAFHQYEALAGEDVAS
ncbi:helix-turn-helix domain-containing protein [Streptomyces kebangsaanensis]|uniref:helix-turn-helix domain-containing protein n=1 Tax=Streptomyces kebangsaanensis TaxID=864058 RepID=UPI0009A0C92B